MPLEIRTVPVDQEQLDGLFDLPGSESAKLIVRREVLRKNWEKLRGQLAPGLGPPPAGISKALNNAAQAAFQAFVDWNSSIGWMKELGGAYEAEVAEQEAIYDMYASKVAKALQSAGKQPKFTTNIPRKDPVAPPPVSQAGMPYDMPEPPQPSTWDTADWVLASLAALSLVYIVVELRKPTFWQDDVDIPEVKPPRGARAYQPPRDKLRFDKGTENEDWATPETPEEIGPRAYSPQYEFEP